MNVLRSVSIDHQNKSVHDALDSLVVDREVHWIVLNREESHYYYYFINGLLPDDDDGPVSGERRRLTE